MLARDGRITEPIEPREIPGNNLFTEMGLQAFEELENTYSAFYIQLIDAEEQVRKFEGRLNSEAAQVQLLAGQ